MVDERDVGLVLDQLCFQPVNSEVAVRVQHHVVMLPEPGGGVVDNLPLVRVQILVGDLAGINPRHFGQDAVHQRLSGLLQGQVVDLVFFGQA